VAPLNPKKKKKKSNLTAHFLDWWIIYTFSTGIVICKGGFWDIRFDIDLNLARYNNDKSANIYMTQKKK